MVKIDMEMPKSCEVCKLKTWEQSGMFNKAVCVYTGKRAKRINDRPEECLLIDCATSNVTTYCNMQFICTNEFTVVVNAEEVCIPLGSIWKYSDVDSGESWYVLYPEDSCVGLSFIQICDLELNDNFMEVI